MIIIGELINTSRKAIGPAVDNRDSDLIRDLAKKQVEAGANYVDVNAGTKIHNEPEVLTWLVKTIQEAVDTPLCIDSPNSKAIEAALEVHRGQALVNSITAERDRYDKILPLVVRHKARVVALCMDDTGIPETAAQRLAIVDVLTKGLVDAGIQKKDIFFDPLVKPVSVNTSFGLEVLDTIREIHQKYPGIHTTCGLSNASFGLPNRRLLNQAFLVLCMGNGMDSVILDPLDKRMMSLLIASKALLGRDEYCVEYLTAYREGKTER